MGPLPINFHRSFKPERRHLGSLLRYSALHRQGSCLDIAAETGIPTGKSSGKLLPTLDYATAMGLLEPAKGARAGIIRPILTPLGRAVYSTDQYLGHELTQWLAHMNLCRGDVGASAWHDVFAKGRQELGGSFTKAQLEAYLAEIYGINNKRTGPMVVTYMDDDSLGRARVLVELGEKLVRRKAPILDSYATAYSAIVLSLMETYFPADGQVTFSDFNEATGWFDICLWDQADLERASALIERRGYVTIDRQRRPWILEKKGASSDLWSHLYDDLA